ncbi:hypothetical protein LXL04_003964 [Taraxacum kok-saghyz]
MLQEILSSFILMRKLIMSHHLVSRRGFAQQGAPSGDHQEETAKKDRHRRSSSCAVAVPAGSGEEDEFAIAVTVGLKIKIEAAMCTVSRSLRIQNGTCHEVGVDCESELALAVGDAIPVIVTAIRGQIVTMMEEQIAAIPAAGGNPCTREFQYRDFNACFPLEFKGDAKPIH